MKIWWCEEHKNSGARVENEVCGMRLYLGAMEYEYGADKENPLEPCRMVEMRLVPVELEVLKDPWDYDP